MTETKYVFFSPRNKFRLKCSVLMAAKELFRLFATITHEFYINIYMTIHFEIINAVPIRKHDTPLTLPRNLICVYVYAVTIKRISATTANAIAKLHGRHAVVRVAVVAALVASLCDSNCFWFTRTFHLQL